MLNFRRIELSDREWIEPLLKMGDHRGSEYTFSNNYIYRDIYHIEVCRMNEYYLVRSHKQDGPLYYLYPSGSGDIKPVIQAMLEDADENGVPFMMYGVSAQAMALLDTLFPSFFTYTKERDNFDYIYESQALITLAGKKLHAKRNFINRFKAEHEGNWEFERITQQNIEECWQMSVKWCEKAGCNEDDSLREETKAVRNCFDHFTALGLQGGALRLDGQIIAYTMGRPLNSDTFIVHIEKAFYEIAGAYPMINQQFVANCCADFKYINREDDVGDEGLRKAKLSYRPAILLEKYCAMRK